MEKRSLRNGNEKVNRLDHCRLTGQDSRDNVHEKLRA